MPDADPALDPVFADPAALTVLAIPKASRTFLSANKRYTRTADGIAKQDFDAGKYFDVRVAKLSGVIEWAALMRDQLARAPHCLVIRGAALAGSMTTDRRRLKENFPDVARHWVDVDFDAMPETQIPRGPAGFAAAREMMPPEFRGAMCWAQRTNSYGIPYIGRKDDCWGGRVRLGFWLASPLRGDQVTRWFRQQSVPCDMSLYRAVQIHYTANPTFVEMEDPIPADERFAILDGAPTVHVPDAVFALKEPEPRAARLEARQELTAATRERLMDAFERIENVPNERHNSICRWATNAFGCGMLPEEIIALGAGKLAAYRRGDDTPDRTEVGEVSRFIEYAERQLANGQLWIDENLLPATAFRAAAAAEAAKSDLLGDGPDEPAPTISAEQAAAQAEDLVKWEDTISTNEKGVAQPTERNMSILLRNHSQTKNCLAWDLFRSAPILVQPPPWWQMYGAGVAASIATFGCPFKTADYQDAKVWLQSLRPAIGGPEAIPIHPSDTALGIAIANAARHRSVNPVRAWLERCEAGWDKVPRLEKVLYEVCHARLDERLAREYFKRWLLQSVRRVFEPGAKADAVLVLQGGQGAKKSTFFAELLPDRTLFKEDLSDIRSKDAMIELHGKLIIELAEGFVLKKSDSEALKSFLSRCEDVFRAPFAIVDEPHPRTAIFGASVNDELFLPEVGGRRWWVVPVSSRSDVLAGNRIDIARVRRERDQWWGEAVALYRQGYPCWLEGDDEKRSEDHAKHFAEEADTMSTLERWIRLPADQGGPPHPDWFRADDMWVRALGNAAANRQLAGRRVSYYANLLGGWKRAEYFSQALSTKFTGYVRIGSEFERNATYRNMHFEKLYKGQKNKPLDTPDKSDKVQPNNPA